MSGQEQNDYMRQMGVHLMFFPLVQKSLEYSFGMLKAWPVTRFVVKHIQLVGISETLSRSGCQRIPSLAFSQIGTQDELKPKLSLR